MTLGEHEQTKQSETKVPNNYILRNEKRQTNAEECYTNRDKED